ncbi:hypothetical protein PHYSODRAFT_498224, partial [Phytophthora sojae]
MVAKAKQQAVSTWSRSQIGHRSEYSVERLLAFKDFCQRTSTARVIAVCFFTPLPALSVAIAIDCIPMRPPSDGWNNPGFWARLFFTAFFIAVGLSFQVKEVLTGKIISNIGVLVISFGTSSCYLLMMFTIAVTWRFPIPYGFVVSVGPYVVIFSIITAFLIIGPKIMAQSPVLRRQIMLQLLIVATQGVLAIVYPIFGAIFYRLSGAELTAFIMVMPVIKFITKQIIAAAAKHLKEYVGPIVVFSVDVFNVFYVAICMQASTSLVTTILMVASDSFHVV